jgi:glutathione peroxidase-family protein
MSSFFDFEANDIGGETVALSKFRDQVSLVVNVASK